MSFVRSFLIAFLAALVVFIPIAYFTVNYLVDEVGDSLAQTTEPGDSQDGPEGSGYEISAVGRLALLMIVTSPADGNPATGANVYSDADTDTDTDADAKKIEFLTLVYYNCDRRQVMITAFPGDTMIQLQGVSMSLSEGYAYMKSGQYDVSDRYIADSVTGCTGIPIDCYAYLDRSRFEQVADELGGLNVEFSEAFTVYNREDGSTRFFPAGTNQLSSSDLHSLLVYEGYNSPATKMQIISAVCKSVLDRESTTANYLDIDRIWAQKAPLYDGYDLGEYESVRDFADQMFSYRLCSATVVPAQGGYEQIGGENLFVVDYSATITLMKQYSR